MVNVEHFALLKQGANAWNRWRAENPTIQPDLSRCDLRRVNLTDAALNRTTLTEADMRRVNLERHNLQAIDFRGANLSDAVLDFSFITDSDLSHARCAGTSFISANLGWATLTRTDFHKAKFAYTSFCNVDLSSAILQAAQHLGPSTVGTDTLIRTAAGTAPGGPEQQQQIIETFLAACGLDDVDIESFRKHIKQPPTYRSAFICYCRSDSDFAKRLHAALSSRKVRCWLDIKDMVIGTIWARRIQEAVREHDRVIVCCSEEAMTTSKWVGQEIDFALHKERETEDAVILPVDIDGYIRTSKSAKARLMRKRSYADFRAWRNPEVFEREVSELLKALAWSGETTRMPAGRQTDCDRDRS